MADFKFNETVEKYTTETKAHADEFNKRQDKLIENDKYIKSQLEDKANKTDLTKDNLKNVLGLKQLAFEPCLNWSEILNKPTIPTKISDLENDSSFIKSSNLIDSVDEDSKYKAPSCFALNTVYKKAEEACDKSNSISSVNLKNLLDGENDGVQGKNCKSKGYDSFSFGSNCVASEYNSVALCNNTVASGSGSVALNFYTIATCQAQTVIGKCNIASKAPKWQFNTEPTDALFIIGNGEKIDQRGNAFLVQRNGEVKADGAYSSSGADYAELFEWIDGNIKEEDRVGYFVTLDGEKIRIANSKDNYILGIVSATPAIIGDNHSMRWKSKFETDSFGRIQYETKKIDGKKTVVPKINKKFDKSRNEEYDSRQERKEWSPIGMLGKLLVHDDGSCTVNGYCKATDGGIATASETGYRVMARITDNIVMVLFK